MSAVAHHAINSLYSRFVHNCKRFRSNQEEMRQKSDAYFRYRDLLHEQQQICDEIVKIFGILGVYSPDVSEDLAKSIASGVSADLFNLIYSDIPIQGERKVPDSAKVRDSLKLWEILQLFLSAADNKATLADFRNFLFKLDLKDKTTPQAIESAIKTHPELFQDMTDKGQKFLVLKQPAFWIQTWELILRSIRTLVRETKRKYAPDADSIDLIESPAHTVVIRIDGIPGAIVQASISLTGSHIKIKKQEMRSTGKFPLPDEIIKIEQAHSGTIYIYDGQHLNGTEEVAEIILAPVLDCVRMA